MGVAAETDINIHKFRPDVCAVYALKLLAIMCIQSEYVYYRKGNHENGGKSNDKI